ncbi:L,D-transpeptidase [Algicella marina]|uniref:L,D-transpeptidase family protein n=1 Tax=Algicella marina TaxID=2683284 RepID=A0A6P1SWN1_9RHOB|nr:L,D-transpeptidase [Algicella marina]QHQ34060.1 L,D-transpeptidase family protein [Algicella marina]
MSLTRRQFTALGLAAAGTALAAPAFAQVAEVPSDTGGVKRRISGFTVRKWQDHFENLDNGAILCDTEARTVYFWGSDGVTTRLYPSSVPLTDELTRRGRTEVTLKRNGPEWRPTPSMLERNPDLPTYVGPGPQNPLGTRALNLSWQYYRIHGTNDVRKIGRRSSNGCIGLFNEHIEELFELAEIGTQVVLL